MKGIRKYLLLLLVPVIWGLTLITIKLSLSWVTPVELSVIRYFPAGILMLSISLLRWPKNFWALLINEWRYLGILGFLGIFINSIALNTGQKYLPSGVVSLIISLVPLFTVLWSIPILSEKPSRKLLLGVAIAFVGIAIVVRFGVSQVFSLKYVYGAMVTVFAALAFSLYGILSRRVTEKYGAFVVATISILFGSIPLIMIGGLNILRSIMDWPHVIWLNAIFLSVFSTVIALTIWFDCIKRISPSRVAMFIYLVPIFGILFGNLILGERISSIFAIGSSLVVLGVLIANDFFIYANHSNI